VNPIEAMNYILSFSDYERSTDEALAPIHYNLDRVRQLLHLLGDPHWRFRSVHVAGTKGKGSTAAMIASVLSCAGFRTGFFSSPHLHSFRERIRVAGELIHEEEICRIVEQIRPAAESLERNNANLGSLTTFEITTALAFRHFADIGVDIAVLEVGLGGRLDATNVVEPLVAVITSISLDHTQVLGTTLAEIAREKAGIIKHGGIVVSAPQQDEALDVIRDVAHDRDAKLFLVGQDWRWQSAKGYADSSAASPITVSGPFGQIDNLKVPLLGEHQLVNAATAVATLQALRLRGIEISDERIRDGIAGVRWPGRIEVLSEKPLIIVDGAHNGDSMHKLSNAIRAIFPGKRVILVFGASADKDLPGMLNEIVPLASHTIITKSAHPRSADTERIASQALSLTNSISVAPDVRTALSVAHKTARPEDIICVTGSLFIVAEAREAMGITSV